MDKDNKEIVVVKTLKGIMNAIKQGMECHFKELNLTAPQGMLITVLARNKRMKVSDLSQQLQLSNSTVSGIIDRLEKQDLVERTRSEEDRRVVYVNLSEKAKEEAMEHFKSIEKKLENMLGNATDVELDEILHGLAVLEKVLERKSNKN